MPRKYSARDKVFVLSVFLTVIFSVGSATNMLYPAFLASDSAVTYAVLVFTMLCQIALYYFSLQYTYAFCKAKRKTMWNLLLPGIFPPLGGVVFFLITKDW
jgi:hypothetical protein